MVEKTSPRAGLEPGTAKSVGQRLIHRTTRVPLIQGHVTRGSETHTVWV